MRCRTRATTDLFLAVTRDAMHKDEAIVKGREEIVRRRVQGVDVHTYAKTKGTMLVEWAQ